MYRCGCFADTYFKTHVQSASQTIELMWNCFDFAFLGIGSSFVNCNVSIVSVLLFHVVQNSNFSFDQHTSTTEPHVACAGATQESYIFTIFFFFLFHSVCCSPPPCARIPRQTAAVKHSSIVCKYGRGIWIFESFSSFFKSSPVHVIFLRYILGFDLTILCGRHETIWMFLCCDWRIFSQSSWMVNGHPINSHPDFIWR